jgi:hypothetical protein
MHISSSARIVQTFRPQSRHTRNQASESRTEPGASKTLFRSADQSTTAYFRLLRGQMYHLFVVPETTDHLPQHSTMCRDAVVN